MNTFVDRDAGFAAFRQGRSFCLRLDGHVDTATTDALARQLRQDLHGTRLRLECSSLRQIDPGAARSLAHAVLAWIQSRDDRSVDILNLDPEIRRTVAWHPLRSLTDTDEVLFLDPDVDPARSLDPPGRD